MGPLHRLAFWPSIACIRPAVTYGLCAGDARGGTGARRETLTIHGYMFTLAEEGVTVSPEARRAPRTDPASSKNNHCFRAVRVLVLVVIAVVAHAGAVLAVLAVFAVADRATVDGLLVVLRLVVRHVVVRQV